MIITSHYCPTSKLCLLISCIVIFLFAINNSSAFDDDDDAHWHDHEPQTDIENLIDHQNKKLPKDKILFKNVKTLVFQRHKRTTARRTHSIPQLSCVGGTAGCKLFTPNEVHCDMLNYNHKEKSKIQWSCRADMSDKVRFNHVDVICEGYDYPEDDYILLGSCGLEFTLDHTDPLDYHEKSYYKHMDEDEKEMHKKKIQQQQATKKPHATRITSEPNTSDRSENLGFFNARLVDLEFMGFQLIYIIAFLALLTLLVILKYFGSSPISSNRPTKRAGSSLLQRPLNYGPLASAVISTKKAC